MRSLALCFILSLMTLLLGQNAKAQCQSLPEYDCAAPCGVTCDYRVPQTQSYQFDLPQDPNILQLAGRLGNINGIGTSQAGQASPYSLPFSIQIPTDYYDISKAGLTIQINSIPYDSNSLGYGALFQVAPSTNLSTTRSLASTNFTGTYVRCVSQTKPATACACIPSWTDTGCLGSGIMGTTDGCGNNSSRADAVACPAACVPAWADTVCIAPGTMGMADGCGMTSNRPEPSCFACVPAWADTGCLSPGVMGTADGCGSISTRADAVACPAACVPAWADTGCLSPGTMGTADGCGNNSSRADAVACPAPTPTPPRVCSWVNTVDSPSGPDNPMPMCGVGTYPPVGPCAESDEGASDVGAFEDMGHGCQTLSWLSVCTCL